MPGPATYAKMFAAGAVLCIGGPALVSYVSPSEEELFKKYNPELQKRALQDREKRQEEFDKYVTKLKEYSKSNKPIWEVAEEEEKKAKAKQALERQRIAEESQRQRDDLRREQKLPPR